MAVMATTVQLAHLAQMVPLHHQLTKPRKLMQRHAPHVHQPQLGRLASQDQKDPQGSQGTQENLDLAICQVYRDLKDPGVPLAVQGSQGLKEDRVAQDRPRRFQRHQGSQETKV